MQETSCSPRTRQTCFCPLGPLTPGVCRVWEQQAGRCQNWGWWHIGVTKKRLTGPEDVCRPVLVDTAKAPPPKAWPSTSPPVTCQRPPFLK